MQQVSVGIVDLYPVNARVDSPARSGTEFFDDAWEFFSLQRTRDWRLHLAGKTTDVTAPIQRTGSFCLGAVDKIRMARASAVHDLHEQNTVGCVHFVGDFAPTSCLLIINDSGLARERAVRPRRERPLRDHEPGASALGIVLLVQLTRHTAVACALTGQRRHGHAVFQGITTKFQRTK